MTAIPAKAAAWQMRAKLTKFDDHMSPSALENLELVTVPTPDPRPGYAVIRLRAAALNYRDLPLIANNGVYPVPLQPGISPGSDGAGTVVAVAPGSPWVLGTEVVLAPANWIDGPDSTVFDNLKTIGCGAMQGTFRQYILMPEDRLVHAPKNLTAEEAAAVPTAYGTSTHALFFGACPTKEGQTVLTMGTGGLSASAIQLASAAGAKVIALSSTDEKLKLARELGATQTINYKTHPDWEKEVLKLTDGRGVDHVLDVGGSSTLRRSVQSIRNGGVVSLLGMLGQGDDSGLALELLMGAKTVKGVLSFSKVMVEETVRYLETNDIHPAIADVYDFEDMPKALQALMSQSKVGKIVVKM